MGDQKRGSAGLFMKMQKDIVHDLLPGFRIQTLERLIQKEKVPGSQKSAQQSHSAALASGQLSGGLACTV